MYFKFKWFIQVLFSKDILPTNSCLANMSKCIHMWVVCCWRMKENKYILYVSCVLLAHEGEQVYICELCVVAAWRRISIYRWELCVVGAWRRTSIYMWVVCCRRMKENKKLQREMEREKTNQQREIERLNREMTRVSGQLRDYTKPITPTGRTPRPLGVISTGGAGHKSYVNTINNNCSVSLCF